ncbi:MAG TPA: hypothetical protein VMD97_10365 [Candidatus Aquilonibacter sp.]|nr:hypothetical protein [Candidatus Aquilonibacter sp.]
MRTIANCIAVFFVLHFIWSYIWNCYRKGYRLDFWHFSLLQMLFTTSIMLPFNRSMMNVVALSPILLRHALPYVDEAYLISALGYGAFVIGGALWRVNLHVGLRQKYSHLLNQPVRAAVLLLRSPRLMMFMGIASIGMMAIILAIYFASVGFGLRVEGFLLTHPGVRPFAQFAAFIAMTVGGLALGRFEIRRERSMLILSLLITIALFFYGARAFLASVIQLPFLVWVVRRRTRVSLFFLVGVSVFGLFGAVILDAVRRSHFSLKQVVLSAGIAIAFGNSFSDTRDFALVLSLWDKTFFWGKTYLAGLLAFVPRFVSPFRDKWSLGVVTATMAGFSPEAHAGLRIGGSGEAYLNFGLPAVILVGLFAGSVTKLIDMRIKEAVVHDPMDVRVYGYTLLALLVGAVTNTSNFSSLYTVGMLLVFMGLVVLISRFIKIPLG